MHVYEQGGFVCALGRGGARVCLPFRRGAGR